MCELQQPTPYRRGEKGADIALYIRALDIAPLQGNIEPFKVIFDSFLRAISIDKVYIETHRDMIIPDEKTLKEIKTYLESKGIKTAAGITVTVNEMDDFKTYCYSTLTHREKIKGFVIYTATLFDEILFDDFFFTNCKCSLCIQAKGKQTWSDFRLKQMTLASKELVLEPAKKVNPNVKVSIKYPNWYEHFQGSGFNLKDQPPMYDGIYTGNETRDAYYSTQHLQPYQSYLIFRYYENIKPGGNKGGWVDPFGATFIERYAQQIWMTLFAKAKELTLFDYHSLQMPIQESQKGPWQNEQSSFSFDEMLETSDFEAETFEIPKMINVARAALEHVAPITFQLGNPIGLKAYKPHHSSGEDFLHNYLGMLGIPMDLVPEFPVEESLIFLTESSAKDENIMMLMQQHLEAGKNLLITSGLVKALEHRGFDDIAQISCSTKTIQTDTFVMGWEPVTYQGNKLITVPQLMTLTNDVWEEISCISGFAGTPFLTSLRYGQGKMFILTIPDNFDDLYQLPTTVVNRLRRTFQPTGIKIRLADTSTKVSLMTYDNDTFVIASFQGELIEATIIVNEANKCLVDLRTGQRLEAYQQKVSVEQSFFHLTIEAQLYNAYRIVDDEI